MLLVFVENIGGLGTVDFYWCEMVFGNELMIGFIDLINLVSRVMIVVFLDMGYCVNMNVSDV